MEKKNYFEIVLLCYFNVSIYCVCHRQNRHFINFIYNFHHSGIEPTWNKFTKETRSKIGYFFLDILQLQCNFYFLL